MGLVGGVLPPNSLCPWLTYVLLKPIVASINCGWILLMHTPDIPVLVVCVFCEDILTQNDDSVQVASRL